ncbi:GspH/FimT family pseudopilin [Halopseudomonas yangmingensis]|uniref:Type II secretion system protein H n=1 Tax=Halopseudomonas yangmingensis TaxID=1720063 RepID=A0A1I4NZF5_9GAMM|nr:GspH/FimT family pseudopilin [Halopseudomonas yangmingensis]SFM20964.1 type IV fimbrial biogenesis protein FimU [Halopseudomonas yangmingensis]
MKHGHQAGVTLLELMILIAIIAIIVTIAVPNLSSMTKDNAVQAQAEEFNALLQYARSHAATNRRSTDVVIDAASGKLDVMSGTVVLRTATLNTGGVKLNPSAAKVTFRTNGTSLTGAFRATVCSESEASRGFVISVLASGRTTLHPRGKDENGNNLGGC